MLLVPYTLVLLRHGQSEWNLKNLFTGWKDPDLTPEGVEEAQAAATPLLKLGPAAFRSASSFLLRFATSALSCSNFFASVTILA